LSKRQILKFPSAVILTLLHPPQKWSLIELINPIEPLYPSTLNV
jgi:hypothetical protein